MLPQLLSHTMFPKVLKTMSFMDNQKVLVPPQILLEYQNIHIKEWKKAKIIGIDPWHYTSTWAFMLGQAKNHLI